MRQIAAKLTDRPNSKLLSTLDLLFLYPPTPRSFTADWTYFDPGLEIFATRSVLLIYWVAFGDGCIEGWC
jgi:hypothetical protein